MAVKEKQQGFIDESMRGQRLDQVLPELFSEYSRSRLQQWLKDGRITVNGEHWRKRDRVAGGELVKVQPQIIADESWKAQDIPLNIIHQDPDLLVVDKAAGMVVHPAAGNHDSTLLNALIYHYPDLAHLPRAGIVHRIDKETSGLLVIARTPAAHKYLVKQIAKRLVSREYQAIAHRVMTGGGTVDEPIGRHPIQRKKMAVVNDGKPAITHYRIIHRFRSYTHIRVILDSGRTHQIRVHMAHIHYPLVGDPVYAGRLKMPKDCSEELSGILKTFRRQALHAARLALTHPTTGESLSWESPLPDDFSQLLQALHNDQTAGEG